MCIYCKYKQCNVVLPTASDDHDAWIEYNEDDSRWELCIENGKKVIIVPIDFCPACGSYLNVKLLEEWNQ